MPTRDRRNFPIRKRDAEFADLFLLELQTKSTREAMLGAARRLGWEWRGTTDRGSWQRPMKDIQVLRRAKKILGRDNVVEYMRFMFDAVGFSPLDATKKLVEHIQGIEYETSSVTKDGEVVPFTAREKPSLDALKHYHKLTMEEQTKKVQIDQRTLVAHRVVGDAPPVTRARVLKSSSVDA